MWTRRELLFVTACGAPPEVKEVTFPPVPDESGRDPTLVDFLRRLRGIIARRDATQLLSVLDSEVIASFGSDPGVASFKEFWGLDRPGNSLVWNTLTECLDLGGAFAESGEFVAPYVFVRFPRGFDIDWLACLRPDVRLLAEPRDDARVLQVLKWHVVRGLDVSGDRYWKVGTQRGQEGYVRRLDVRSMIDYRVGFKKANGRWLLVFLVAGD